MKLSLDALLVLDAIDRKGSFAAAATELHRVPSAITYTVRKLEDDLDVALFDRRGYRAVLTASGRELLTAGRVLLVAAGELEYRVKRVASGWEAELRIAVDTAVPLTAIWPLVAAFYADCRDRQAAHTRLRLTTEVLGGGWDALVDGRADLVIGAPGDPPGGGVYRTRLLADVTTVFAVAPDHPLASHPEPLPNAVIQRHRAVAAADSSRRLPPATIGLLEGQETLTVADLPAKVAAQVAGLGCGFLPAHLAAAEIAAGSLVVKAVETPRPPGRIHLAWRIERPGKALQWWIDAVQRSGLGQQMAAGAAAPRSDNAARRKGLRATSAASRPRASSGRVPRG
jgi:DNA-binding transcriptional LysR family regulator